MARLTRVTLVGGALNGEEVRFDHRQPGPEEVFLDWEGSLLVRHTYVPEGRSGRYRHVSSVPDACADAPPWPEVVYADVAWEGEAWWP